MRPPTTAVALVTLIVSHGSLCLAASGMQQQRVWDTENNSPAIQEHAQIELKREHRTENTSYNIGGGLASDSDGLETCGCEGLFVGDWVIATSSLGSGPGAGAQGVIISSKESYLRLLVEWQDWDGGHDGNGVATCTPYEVAGNSRWWVNCEDVVRDAMILCACDGIFHIGQRVISNSLQESGPGPGATGTIIGGKSSGTLHLLVQWDNWYGGHGGNGHQSSLCPPALESGSSRWYVECSSVTPMVSTTLACAADVDGNGIVDGADLNVVLGAWGVCP